MTVRHAGIAVVATWNIRACLGTAIQRERCDTLEIAVQEIDSRPIAPEHPRCALVASGSRSSWSRTTSAATSSDSAQAAHAGDR